MSEDQVEKYEKSIEDLFNRWKSLHLNDGEIAENMPKTQRPSAFIRDGLPYPHKYFSLPIEKRLLFILKESHAENAHINSSQLNWYRDFAEGCDDSGQKLRSKLASAYISLTGTSITDREAIRFLAVININKRGGSSSAADRVLENYACKYKGFIKDQIILINPKYIICCGSGIHNLVKKIIYEGAVPADTVLINMYHPSRRGIDIEKFATDCKNAYTEQTRTSEL
ncbi:MAG: hypothetical protein FWH57_11975 [Oscillospiraceae bacterium]|nr:hypothetical protein [Oscillospiraceae bacterium]